MAYETFIPTVEAAGLLKERDKHLVFVANCSREYEGLITKKGDQVRIKVAGAPTIYQLQKDGTYTANQVGVGSIAGTGKEVIHKGIPDAEEIENAEINLPVNQMAVWNFGIGNIDQENVDDKGLVAKYRVKQGKALANVHDQYVAKVMANYKDCYNPNFINSSTKAHEKAKITAKETPGAGETNILSFIDEIVLVLNQRDVSDGTPLVMECTPKLWMKIKQAYRDLDTDNSQMLAGRKCGVYNDVKIVKTNNAIVGGKEYCFVRTLDSVTFFDPLTTIKPYEKEKGFFDAIKGFNLYDAGIVAPKEIIVTEIEYA